MRELHGVADDQGAPGAEEQRQDVWDRALAGLVDDDEIEQGRAQRETPGGETGDGPTGHRGRNRLAVGVAQNLPHLRQSLRLPS
ncbi:hypothetical protein AB0C61_36300 [Streptomyces sp. NPDC048680]|uniref:hypothetical protein n=1 Tax=Streptomyces sp. NPDC048680 TaxID=3155492 RepID=UPI0034423410